MKHEYLTIRDVAQLLQVNDQTVRRWIWNGKLAYIKVGQTVRVPKSELDSMLIRQQKHLRPVTQSNVKNEKNVKHQLLAAEVLSQLDSACEQIRTHVGEVEDSAEVLARVRQRSLSHENE